MPRSTTRSALCPCQTEECHSTPLIARPRRTTEVPLLPCADPNCWEIGNPIAGETKARPQVLQKAQSDAYSRQDVPSDANPAL
jgi:hypothetical protein